jgi:vanillate O-demethylase ferredoxin subunit
MITKRRSERRLDGSGCAVDLKLRVARVIEEADRIRSFELRSIDDRELPAFEPGAHIVVKLPNGMMRQYSLAGDAQDRHRYLIAVLREDRGRGASVWMHENIRPGGDLTVGPPVNRFPLARQARRHLLIAGGIGITPMLAMAQKLSGMAADYALIYCTRAPENTAFRELLSSSPFRPHVHFVHDGGEPSHGLDIAGALALEPRHAHVYCCGPKGMIQAFRSAARGRPGHLVHYESFIGAQAPQTDAAKDRAFAIVIASSGQRIEVPAGASILTALALHGVTVPKLCEAGYCGSCLTRVLEGVPEHRDTVQSDAEKVSNEFITLCCSRAQTEMLVLDL